MIINKFNYEKLSRKNEDGVRKYLTPDGSRVASVTSILDKTKSAESAAALHNWRRAVGHAKAQEITTLAAGRGTRMHSYLEGYIKTGKLAPPGSNPYAKESNGMAQIVIDNGLVHLTETYAVEASLYYPEIYAGTTDLVGLDKGELAIIDYKQANKVKSDDRVVDYKTQLAAYIEAHDKVHGTKIKQGVILMCCKDGTFQSWEVTGNELAKFKDEWWRRVETYYVGLA